MYGRDSRNRVITPEVLREQEVGPAVRTVPAAARAQSNELVQFARQAGVPHAESLANAFGAEQLRSLSASSDSTASDICAAHQATARTKGNNIAFASTPSLQTAAHEMAHVIQQRQGRASGNMSPGQYRSMEAEARAVAAKVVRGDYVGDSMRSASDSVQNPAIQCESLGGFFGEEIDSGWRYATTILPLQIGQDHLSLSVNFKEDGTFEYHVVKMYSDGQPGLIHSGDKVSTSTWSATDEGIKLAGLGVAQRSDMSLKLTLGSDLLGVPSSGKTVHLMMAKSNVSVTGESMRDRENR
ncbi:MAG: DUF4157 domain-containing protein [Myxococcales bacterium]|nr:DUF4157 domain-containing protein [Myxococcales bacterium]